jgi:signal transduction histidine kinase
MNLAAVLRSRRLEDHIRTLSEKLTKAQGEEFHQLALELRTAISDHVGRIRARLPRYPLADDRRQSDKS